MATTKRAQLDSFTLDPATSEQWQDLRTLAHRMVDDMLDHLAALRDQPVWQSMPQDVRASFNTPAPREGEGEQAVYEQFVRNILPYSNGNRHPRFWGWVQGQGTPLGMMADMLAAGMNANIWKVTKPIERLIRSRVPVDAAALADPSVPLESLAGAGAAA